MKKIKLILQPILLTLAMFILWPVLVFGDLNTRYVWMSDDNALIVGLCLTFLWILFLAFALVWFLIA